MPRSVLVRGRSRDDVRIKRKEAARLPPVATEPDGTACPRWPAADNPVDGCG
jgi:hypothetical protein